MQSTVQRFEIRESSFFGNVVAHVSRVADRLATSLLLRYSGAHREAAHICEVTLARNLWRVKMVEACDTVPQEDVPTVAMICSVTKAQYGDNFLHTKEGQKAILARLEAAFPAIRFPAAPQ